MKKFFAQDKIIVGLVAGLGAELAFVLLLTIGLVVAGEPIMDHIRWYGGMFIALIIPLHFYSKRKEQLTVTKTLIVILFATFVAFMAYLMLNRIIVLR